MQKYDYEKIKAHDVGTRHISVLITLFLEITFIIVGIMGLIVWNMYFLTAICFINLLVLPFVLGRNIILWLDFRFYGKTDHFEKLPFIKHSFVLGLIELCIFGASFPFLKRVYFVLVAISLPVILALVMLLVMERNTYAQVHKYLDMDKQLIDKSDNNE
ncbi:MAG: hypothetical protein NTV44_03370 [Firmicutes bacterium]|nr:hypothetical protein [Bacillota bacterium]